MTTKEKTKETEQEPELSEFDKFWKQALSTPKEKKKPPRKRAVKKK